MPQDQADRDSRLRLKIEELDRLEGEMKAVRPRSQLREKVFVLFLLVVIVGAVVAALVEPGGLRTSLWGLAALYAFARCVAISSQHDNLKVLEWQRSQLLKQDGEALADDTI